MNRCLALILALMFSTVTVASACVASTPDRIAFTLDPARGDAIQVRFHDDERAAGRNSWSSAFSPSELAGLDVAALRESGRQALRFAVVREAGRLDCAGTGGDSRASGQCRFTPDVAFSRLLEARGIGNPTRKEAFGLTALNVRRALVDAIARSGYPAPTIDQLMAMTAVGVDERYIADLARLGYRPRSISSLVEFRALGITPAFIGGFAGIGYRDLAPDDLVQLKALGVTPEYVTAFQRLGYRDLPVGKLVEMKALGITPEFVRSVDSDGRGPMPVSQLVRRKIFGQAH